VAEQPVDVIGCGPEPEQGACTLAHQRLPCDSDNARRADEKMDIDDDGEGKKRLEPFPANVGSGMFSDLSSIDNAGSPKLGIWG